MVSVGLMIYMALPQALLSQNIGLVLQVLALVMLGMMVGVALLTANVEHFVCLVWA